MAEFITEQQAQKYLIDMRSAALQIKWISGHLRNTDTVKGSKMNRIYRNASSILETINSLLKIAF